MNGLLSQKAAVMSLDRSDLEDLKHLLMDAKLELKGSTGDILERIDEQIKGIDMLQADTIAYGYLHKMDIADVIGRILGVNYDPDEDDGHPIVSRVLPRVDLYDMLLTIKENPTYFEQVDLIMQLALEGQIDGDDYEKIWDFTDSLDISEFVAEIIAQVETLYEWKISVETATRIFREYCGSDVRKIYELAGGIDNKDYIEWLPYRNHIYHFLGKQIPGVHSVWPIATAIVDRAYAKGNSTMIAISLILSVFKALDSVEKALGDDPAI